MLENKYFATNWYEIIYEPDDMKMFQCFKEEHTKIKKGVTNLS